jgi:outer membrane protein OmpA-like peptidoglycan-associated protein
VRRTVPELDVETSSDHWMLYSDLMAGLVMMFILFLAVTIVNYHHTLAAKERRINQLLGVQASIARSLERTFRRSNLHMSIDPRTGAINFASDIFFAFDSYQLSPAGEQSLRRFIPEYLSVLLAPRYRRDIAAIIVEGYTDREGSYLYNLNLSQERASAVVNYILSSSFPNLPDRVLLQHDLVAEGRSFNDPVYINGVYSPSASRRVVFAFQVKDTAIMRAVVSAASTP